jgi:glycerate 2-kinase
VKEIAQRIFRKTLAAVDVRAAFEAKLERQGPFIHAAGRHIDLRQYREILAIAIGKAAFAMAEGLESVLAPDFSARGILAIPSPPARAIPGWEIFTAGHPVPTAASFAAGRAILDLLKQTTEHTLIFFLLSGGGSSLVESPLDPGISLADFQQLHQVLVTCGAPIEEINAIRKHLSATKGGRLALAAPHATMITLGITDVPEGHQSALASGPTLPDPTTISDVERVVDRYAIAKKLPASIRAALESRSLVETPKPGDAAFNHAYFALLLGMHDLIHHAHLAAEAEGFHCDCDYSTDNWPIERAADHLLALLESLRIENPGVRVAVIADGEVSSPVTGDGIGGRNSAFALACVSKIASRKIAVLSAGTDGVDGNSPAAGAVADGETLARAEALGLNPSDYFRRSDSFTFFERLGDAVHTGPTGNNLRDLRLLLAW